MITKLVLPVAGLGTRLRPLTLVTPKNLITVAGRPLLEYVLDEALSVGIKDVILVINPAHFSQYRAYLVSARKKYPKFNFHIRVQENPWGHGHAVLQAADIIKDEPFLVRFCDDIIVSEKPALKILTRVFEEYKSPVLLLEQVSKEEVGRYGVVKAEKVYPDTGVWKISGFVEKPKPEETPSDLIVIGGYALTPEVMAGLKRLEKNMRRENDSLLIYDPILEMLVEGKPVYGREFDGKRLDCGTLAGLKTAEEYLRKLKSQNSKIRISA